MGEGGDWWSWPMGVIAKGIPRSCQGLFARQLCGFKTHTWIFFSGRDLSPGTRKEQGFELSPDEEKLLTRQVTPHCVCACVMACARIMAFVWALRWHYWQLWLSVQGDCIPCCSWQAKGRQMAQSRLTHRARLRALSWWRTALGAASDWTLCVSLYIYIYIYRCTHIYVYMYTYIYIYVYTY